MELLAEFGTPGQQQRWLRPLLAADIRSCFCMTEPDVASSDPTGLATTIRRDGGDLVVSGRKWWSTGTADPRCALAGFAMAQARLGPDEVHLRSIARHELNAQGLNDQARPLATAAAIRGETLMAPAN